MRLIINKNPVTTLLFLTTFFIPQKNNLKVEKEIKSGLTDKIREERTILYNGVIRTIN